MTNKPTILIFIDWFTPGFKAGGPIKSVTNIVQSLANDFNIFIITSDRDIEEQTPYSNITFNTWIKQDHYSIAYLSPDKRTKFITNELISNSYDNIYFNSFFSKNYTLEPLRIIRKLKINSKIIIAPRGMLGKGALSIKPLKKQLFISISKLFGFYKNVCWHATNIEEKKDIISIFGNDSTIYIASNISIISTEKKPILKEVGELRLVFFSRISPKKNLAFALSMLKKLNNKSISLDVFGTIEDAEYWTSCNNIIEEANLNVHYKGELLPSVVQEKLSNYHFLFLPTLHENYGHVIVEALTSGCGLILSNNTPWRKLKDKQIGYDIDLSNEIGFIEALNECVNMNQEQYNQVRNNCYSFVLHEIDPTKDINDTKLIFNTPCK
ncbi:MAG: glycosyltransferase [Flavobacteriales bacterium]|nr:glycosyltransferase [Flavobacteriales bacterium]MCB9499666.1 glycosyltransferase [Erysipelotrichaceae bacterium]